MRHTKCSEQRQSKVNGGSASPLTAEMKLLVLQTSPLFLRFMRHMQRNIQIQQGYNVIICDAC